MNKDLDCGPLDDSLTNIQWLGRMSTSGFEPDPAKQMTNKENQDSNSQMFQVSWSLLLMWEHMHVWRESDLRLVSACPLNNNL